MKNFNPNLIKGKLLTIIENEYSDTVYYGPFEILRDFNIEFALKEWAKYCYLEPEKDHIYGHIYYDTNFQQYPKLTFLGWLIKNEYIKDVECTEINIGAYGHISLS